MQAQEAVRVCHVGCLRYGAYVPGWAVEGRADGADARDDGVERGTAVGGAAVRHVFEEDKAVGG